jgi:CBS domain containing-hemolysin-like protein
VDTEIALQQRLDRYCDYLQRTGHASDVLWVRTEMNRGAVVHEITNCALKTTSWLKPFIASLVTWILSFSLFVCFVSTAAGMILGSLIPKSWRLKRRRAPLRARQLRGIRFIFGFFVLLIYLYPILVLYAAHVDTQASQAFDRMLTYEGSYVAASVHREWPGPPDASAGRQP